LKKSPLLAGLSAFDPFKIFSGKEMILIGILVQLALLIMLGDADC